MKTRARGFTLIELMVVVTLIGVMIAIAVPSFAAFVSNYRATSAANDLLQAITQARTEALKQGRRVTIAPNLAGPAYLASPSGSWSNGWTIFVDYNNDQTLNGSDVLIFKHPPLPATTTPGLPTSASAIFGSNYVVFDGSGYPHTSPGSTSLGGITIKDRNSSVRTLCLALLGRPRLTVGTTAATCANG